MDRWVDFDVVTHDALWATLDELGVERPPDLASIAAAFGALPLADGAGEALRQLREAGLVVGVLTNASARLLDRVADRLALPLDHRLSVDAVRRFKPHPSVYRLAVDATRLPPARIGFVTANGWDAAGASAFGLRVCWLRPSPAAILPPVGAPEPIVATWHDLASIFLSADVRV